MPHKFLVIKKQGKWKLWQGRKTSTQHDLSDECGIKNGQFINVIYFNGPSSHQYPVNHLGSASGGFQVLIQK